MQDKLLAMFMSLGKPLGPVKTTLHMLAVPKHRQPEKHGASATAGQWWHHAVLPTCSPT